MALVKEVIGKMTDEELEERRTMLTASEYGAAYNMHPYYDLRTLIASKKGQLPPQESMPYMRAGKRWERHIAAVYAEETGREVEWRDRFVRHPEYSWLGGSPDAVVPADEEVLECKLAQWHQRHKFGPGPEDVPEYMILQMQIQMAVMGYKRAKLVVWAGESDLRVYPYKLDPEMVAVMVEHGKEIVDRYLVGDELPPITGSDGSDAWLRHRFPRNFSSVREATTQELLLLENYTDIRIKEKLVIDPILEDKKLLENQLKELTGDSDGIEWFGGRFTWKAIKDKAECDWETLAQTLLLSRPEEERERLISQHTAVVPGYRRIHFRSDRLREIA